MNILVTGGLGFVGSHLIEACIKEKHKVFCLDNLFTGSEENKIDGCSYFFGETKDICEIFKNQQINLVYHLGEYSKVEQSFDDIDKVFSFNWNSIYEVLKFIKLNKAKLVYSGSSTKFGDEGETMYSSPYAFTKMMNTRLIKTYCDWFDIKYAISYFYNVYGPREIDEGNYATVIAKFIKMKKQNSDFLPITKPGTQRRNFTHINDIIEGLLLVGKYGEGDNYGIGSKKSYSIIELANLLDMPYELTSEKKGNRFSAPVKTENIEKLGWKEKYQLEDYIKKVFS